MADGSWFIHSRDLSVNIREDFSAAFDGQRVLVTNVNANTVTLWKAADLTPLGSFSVGATPYAACSDGINFWIALNGAGQLARF